MSSYPEVYEKARRVGLLDLWVVARTPVHRRYPCKCTLGRRCDPRWCPCSGRVDLDGQPAHCCAHTNTPEVAAAAHIYIRPVAPPPPDERPDQE